jgi:AraC family transcriptional regulator, regulatory protein of adaptative response / methylated-DNA-[protein]-cysteine methyltransferase
MNEELYWQAVKANDHRFDGVFVLGVKTTGIYCRPSCRARLPKRENVDFYESPMSAERVGYRACKRCIPTDCKANLSAEAVIKACSILEQREGVTLEELSAGVGLSSFHLQKVFKELIGVSPKRYAEAKKMEKFKGQVRNGSDVTTAMYDAGFGSSSRLYEKADESLGMTPAVFQKGGAGMKINFVVADCELGKMLVARTERGICSVTFGDDVQELEAGLHAEFPRAEIRGDDTDLQNAIDAILEYLNGSSKRFVLPMDLRATAFQLQVWEILRTIPYGETRSYTEIARVVGDKKKVRAVAQACAKNRVAVLIPCHRVVASDGKLSGYRWGVQRKEKLLQLEKE